MRVSASLSAAARTVPSIPMILLLPMKRNARSVPTRLQVATNIRFSAARASAMWSADTSAPLGPVRGHEKEIRAPQGERSSRFGEAEIETDEHADPAPRRLERLQPVAGFTEAIRAHEGEVGLAILVPRPVGEEERRDVEHPFPFSVQRAEKGPRAAQGVEEVGLDRDAARLLRVGGGVPGDGALGEDHEIGVDGPSAFENPLQVRGGVAVDDVGLDEGETHGSRVPAGEGGRGEEGRGNPGTRDNLG